MLCTFLHRVKGDIIHVMNGIGTPFILLPWLGHNATYICIVFTTSSISHCVVVCLATVTFPPTLAFPSDPPLPSLPSPTCGSKRPPDICIRYLTFCIVRPQRLQWITALKGDGPPLSTVTRLQHDVAYYHKQMPCSMLCHAFIHLLRERRLWVNGCRGAADTSAKQTPVFIALLLSWQS